MWYYISIYIFNCNTEVKYIIEICIIHVISINEKLIKLLKYKFNVNWIKLEKYKLKVITYVISNSYF